MWGSISVSPLTLKKVKPSNNSAVVIIYSTVTKYSLLTTSVFWFMRAKSIYWKLKKPC